MMNGKNNKYGGLLRWSLPLCLFVLGLLASEAAFSKEKGGSAVDSDPTVIRTRVAKSLASYDMNASEKNLIDFHFSPLQAMPVYRSLLLWTKDYHAEDGLRSEMLNVIREGMLSIIRDSGAGLPMSDWAGEGKPISLIYIKSQPRYAQPLSPSNMESFQWMREGLVENVTPGSIGQSLAAKALVISIDPGQDTESDTLILSSLLQELDILSNKLFYKKKLMAAGQGAYVPEVLTKDDEGKWQALDPTSRLISQAYLVQGLSHVLSMLSDNAVVSRLFKNAEVQGRTAHEWYQMTQRALESTLDSMTRNHFDAEANSFVSNYMLKKGQSKKLAIREAGVVADALYTVLQALAKDHPLRGSVEKHLIAQAAFIKNALKGKMSRIPKGVLVSKKVPVYGLTQEFTDAASIMSLMLLAYKVDDDKSFESFVEDQYPAVNSEFWSEHGGTYRSAKGYKVSSYNGQAFSLVLNWMQHMHWVFPEMKDFQEHSRDFIQTVLKKGGLLQAEGNGSGEVKSLDDYLGTELDSFVKELAETNTVDHGALIEKFVKKAADQDQDGVPGMSFAGGRHGAAPVIIIETSVPTPFYQGKPDENGVYRRNYGF